MGRTAAFLVDVYNTILTCDFEPHSRELPAIAGVPVRAWEDGLARLGPALTDGRLSLAQGYEQILQACGAQPRSALVRELVRREGELLRTSARLYDDAIPFLEMLKSRGIMIAIVSNCTENTRRLLTELGVSAVADSLVLSCEAGCAKPAAGIYRQALDLLGVPAGRAVFVDDQADFCAGAAAVGIRAVQLVRGDEGGSMPAAGIATVGSLLQAEAML